MFVGLGLRLRTDKADGHALKERGKPYAYQLYELCRRVHLCISNRIVHKGDDDTHHFVGRNVCCFMSTDIDERGCIIARG